MSVAKSNHGMSLIEVVIAMGVAGVVSLGVASQMKFLTREQNNVNQVMNFYNLTSYLQLAISNNNNCGVALGFLTPTGNNSFITKTVSVNLPTSTSNTAITSLSIYGPSGATFATSNLKLGSMTISSINLELSGSDSQVAGSNDLLYTGNVVLTATKGGQTLGASSLTNSFPVRVRVTNVNSGKTSGNLYSCSAFKTTQTAASILNSSSCDNLSVAVPTTDNSSITCKQVLCGAGSLPSFSSNGILTCTTSSACNASGYGMVYVSSQWKCKRLVCPLGQIATSYDSDGYISGCSNDYDVIQNCARNTTGTCDYSTFKMTYLYSCPSGKICTQDCSTLKDTSSACTLSDSSLNTDQCRSAGGTPVYNSSSFSNKLYCQTNSQSCPSNSNGVTWAYRGTYYSVASGTSRPSGAQYKADLNGTCCAGNQKAGSCNSATIRDDSTCRVNLNNNSTVQNFDKTTYSGWKYHNYVGMRFLSADFPSSGLVTSSPDIPQTMEYPSVQYCKLCKSGTNCSKPNTSSTANCGSNAMSCYGSGSNTCQTNYASDRSYVTYNYTTYCN